MRLRDVKQRGTAMLIHPRFPTASEHRMVCAPAVRLRPIAPAFTLIETLVVISIMAILLSMLLPALKSARATVKSLECSTNMRTVSTEFSLFAEGLSAEGRGDSESLRGNRFRINDFQDQLYQIDEFWNLGLQTRGAVGAGDSFMVCPAGSPDLVKRKGLPCSAKALGPPQNVSLAVNMRLYRAAVEFMGRRVLAPAASTLVSPRILHYPDVPLVLDVDGRQAARRGVEPFYIAPPVRGLDDPYSDGRYWTPSKRHHGRTNVAFVGGHVLSSEAPASERWDWSRQGEAGQ